MSIIIILILGTISLAAPLMAAAYGGMFSERSGVVNIGLEGMMTVGAFAAAATVALMDIMGLGGHLAIIVGTLMACFFGGLLALLHAWLSVSLKVDQVIGGTVINIFSAAITIYLTKLLFGQANTPTIKSTPLAFLSGKLTLISVIIILLAIVFYLVLNKTKWGVHVLAVGENPSSADAMGINVMRVRYQAVILSGVLGGLGGAAIVFNTTSNFSAVTVAGSGFIALAVLIFGRHNPFGVLIAGLIFGFFKNLGTVISTIDPALLPNLIRGLTEVPSVVYQMLPYMITIVVLVLFSRNKISAMEALGEPYDKEVR